MIEQLRKYTGHWAVALGIILAGLLGGCVTGGPKYADLPQDTAVGTTFHIGDAVTVSAVPPSGDITQFAPVAQRVAEDGTINLPLIGSVTALGKTAAELQRDIHDRYVPKYYQELSVTVKGEALFFYVDGEVAQRGQKEYPGEMTIVKAIAAAGGFTDFADQKNVRLTRGSHTQVINVKKAVSDPKYDVPVLPGDKIYVPRKILF
ncbi:MAG TPA: polysaccharide biosynthesis/export family protein [Verrucomicrobiae bacterium]|nr:polysaccharide biosynthesis/export family protein [Verrucomicrobiae bacterium]